MENIRRNAAGGIDCDISINGIDFLCPTTLCDSEAINVINSGVEIAPYTEPVKTLNDIRAERDLLLAQNVDIYNPMRWAELTTAQKDSVKSYRQALLDITLQDPTSVVWPEVPLI